MSPHSDSSLGKTSSRQGGKAEFPLPITLKRGLLTLMSKLAQMPKGGEAAGWLLHGRCQQTPWASGAEQHPWGPGCPPDTKREPHMLSLRARAPGWGGAPREAPGPPAGSALEQPTPLPSTREGANRSAAQGKSYPLSDPTSANPEGFTQTVCIVLLIYYHCARHSHLPLGDLAWLAPAHRYENCVSHDLLPHKRNILHSYKFISVGKKKKEKR